MGARKNNDFGVLLCTKQDKKGQNDPHSATDTQLNEEGDTLFFSTNAGI
jgi:hypothetical protein